MQSYTLTNFLLHWNMDQKTEIRSYIKCRIRPNIDSKQIFNELCGIYEPQTISMRTGFRWVKAFKAGKFSVEDDTRPGRPKTSVTKVNTLLWSNRMHDCLSKTLLVVLAYKKAVCKQF